MRVLIVSLLVACGEPEPLNVLAAASLSESLEDAASAFEARDEAEVELSFAGSQILARQIEQGAPADVLVAASMEHTRGASFEDAAVLVCNAPVLVVPPSSPIRSFRDLPSAERVVLGTAEVPIGAYSEQILAGAGRLYGARFEAGVRDHIASRELDVRRVLARVVEGDADAAIVYRSDARLAGGRVRAIDVPPELQTIARYPIAIVRRARSRGAAERFVRFLRSDEGQAIFVRYGFERCR